MDQILQALTVTFAVVGTFLLGSLSSTQQLAGFTCYLIGNGIAVMLFTKRQMFIMVIQYILFTILAINGILNRI